MTRLGDFLKFFMSNFTTKVAQIFGDFLSFLTRVTVKVITVVATFWASIGENLAPFYSNIWSRCALDPSLKCTLLSLSPFDYIIACELIKLSSLHPNSSNFSNVI